MQGRLKVEALMKMSKNKANCMDNSALMGTEENEPQQLRVCLSTTIVVMGDSDISEDNYQ